MRSIYHKIVRHEVLSGITYYIYAPTTEAEYLATLRDLPAAPTPDGESIMEDRNQPQDESSKPYRLQLITGTGKVLWEQSLPSLCLLTALAEKGSLSGQKLLVYLEPPDGSAACTLLDSY